MHRVIITTAKKTVGRGEGDLLKLGGKDFSNLQNILILVDSYSLDVPLTMLYHFIRFDLSMQIYSALARLLGESMSESLARLVSIADSSISTPSPGDNFAISSSIS